MSKQRVLKELPAVSALLFTGSRYCPDAHIPLSPLSNPPVNNNMPKRLLSGIISRGAVGSNRNLNIPSPCSGMRYEVN